MNDFQEREQNYPDSMSALITAFGTNVTRTHQEIQLANAQYIQALAAMDNLRWAVEIGILTMEQSLTLMGNIPIFCVADTDPFVFTDASLDMEMRVSASNEESKSLEVSAGMEAGIEGGFGPVKGSLKLKADVTNRNDNKRSSDYSSTVKTSIKMQRVPAPEGVQLIRDTTNAVVQSGLKINQTLIERQVEALNAETQTGDVPQSLPENILTAEDTTSSEGN